MKPSAAQAWMTPPDAFIPPQSMIWCRPRGGLSRVGAWPMVERLLRLLFSVSAMLLLAGAPALAHPHVWVVMKSELIYAPDGSLTGVRHAWKFDDMFSTFATQGLESKVKGAFTREELAPLAEVNVSSLKEFDYFTQARANGKKTAFGDAADYWLDFTNGALTLHFTLPLKTPVKAQSLEIAVYDPTIFVDFALAPKDAVTLVGAPAACKLDVVAAGGNIPSDGRPNEGFFSSLNAQSNYGAQYANKFAVKCP
jgi:ABC-type uncharacterized transport system substrate-binding protein